MAIQLLPVLPTEKDSLGVATVINKSYFESNRFYRTIFPAEQSALIRATALRWPKNLYAPGTWHLKLEDPVTGQIISYSRWVLPDYVLKYIDNRAPLTSEQKKKFERDFEAGSDNGAPKYMNTAMTDAAELNAEEARKHFPPGHHIKLDMIMTLPSHKGQGHASTHIKWGLALADKEHLPVYLEATEAARDIYLRYGFEEVTRTVDDLSIGGGSGTYVQSFMIRRGR